MKKSLKPGLFSGFGFVSVCLAAAEGRLGMTDYAAYLAATRPHIRRKPRARRRGGKEGR